MKREPEYKKIAQKLIKTDADLEYIKESLVKIAYVSSDEAKLKNKKLVLGTCTKVSKEYEWCCKYDFFITIYEPNIYDFTQEQLEILIKHELMHIGISNDGNEPSYYIVPHDYEDFKPIIEKHGLDWTEKRTE